MYDAFTDFSAVSNPVPGGRWSYGWEARLGDTLNLYEFVDEANYPAGWVVSADVPDPSVRKNTSGEDVYADNGIVFPGADYLHVHPGGSELSVIRWTAPSSDLWHISAKFKGLRQWDQTTTDVHILHNSVPIFDAQLIAGWYDPEIPAELTLQLQPGDTIDFAVGSLGWMWGDSTGVKATITLATTPVSISIAPSSFVPGSSSTIQVAILGTSQMDVTTIDRSSVRFGQTGVEAVPIASSLRDVDHDGKLDLSFIFRIKDTGIKCFATSAKLTGASQSGPGIEGSNTINTLGCERCPSP